MFNTQTQAHLKFFTCFHNIAINNGVLKLNKEAHLVLFIGPQGQYVMWFTGPYWFLLALGQRASVSVDPCIIWQMSIF